MIKIFFFAILFFGFLVPLYGQELMIDDDLLFSPQTYSAGDVKRVMASHTLITGVQEDVIIPIIRWKMISRGEQIRPEDFVRVKVILGTNEFGVVIGTPGKEFQFEGRLALVTTSATRSIVRLVGDIKEEAKGGTVVFVPVEVEAFGLQSRTPAKIIIKSTGRVIQVRPLTPTAVKPQGKIAVVWGAMKRR